MAGQTPSVSPSSARDPISPRVVFDDAAKALPPGLEDIGSFFKQIGMLAQQAQTAHAGQRRAEQRLALSQRRILSLQAALGGAQRRLEAAEDQAEEAELDAEIARENSEELGSLGDALVKHARKEARGRAEAEELALGARIYWGRKFRQEAATFRGDMMEGLVGQEDLPFKRLAARAFVEEGLPQGADVFREDPAALVHDVAGRVERMLEAFALRVEKLEADAAQYKPRLEGLEEDHESAQRKGESLRKELREVREARDVAQRGQTAAQREIERLRAELKASQDAQGEQERALRRAKSAQAAAERAARTATAGLDAALQRGRAERGAEVERLKKALCERNEELSRIAQKEFDGHKRIERAETLAREAERRCMQGEQRTTRAEAELYALRQRMEALKGVDADAEVRARGRQVEVEDLLTVAGRELQSAKAQLEETKRALGKARGEVERLTKQQALDRFSFHETRETLAARIEENALRYKEGLQSQLEEYRRQLAESQRKEAPSPRSALSAGSSIPGQDEQIQALLEEIADLKNTVHRLEAGNHLQSAARLKRENAALRQQLKDAKAQKSLSKGKVKLRIGNRKFLKT